MKQVMQGFFRDDYLILLRRQCFLRLIIRFNANRIHGIQRRREWVNLQGRRLNRLHTALANGPFAERRMDLERAIGNPSVSNPIWSDVDQGAFQCAMIFPPVTNSAAQFSSARELIIRPRPSAADLVEVAWTNHPSIR